MKFSNIVVLGIGKVGTLVSTLLTNSGFSVTAVDSKEAPNKLNCKFVKIDVADKNALMELFKQNEAVVSCLPYDLNKGVASCAYEAGIHFFDLTEDVESTEFIKKIASDSKAVMAPQCGLAPGFISIVGASLAAKFTSLRSMELRVGALPQHPKGGLGYAFNWSPEGVVNEYLNDCICIKDGQLKKVPAMQDLEKIIIKGNSFEAFTTSGGLGTLCETFEGKLQELNYKTMRYPGHMNLMRFYFHELLMKEDRKNAGKVLVNAKPPVNDDVVYVHAAVEGMKDEFMAGEETLCREEFVEAYYPKVIDGEHWRAISWTTASSICATIELVANGKIRDSGFLKQEEISLDDFLNTKNGRMYKEK